MTLINKIPNPSGSVPPIYTKGDTPTYNLWVTCRGWRTRGGCLRGWLRGPAPALAGRLQGKMRFLRCAPGILGVCLQRSFRRGPAAAAVCGARGCRGSAGVMSESELGVVFGKGLSGGRPALHSLGRLLRFSALFHRRTLRIKLLPGPIPVLSYGFNC